MNDELNSNTDDTAQYEEKANSTNRSNRISAEELVQTHLDTFVELAESGLPIAEDAQKAIALTDGGEDQ